MECIVDQACEINDQPCTLHRVNTLSTADDVSDVDVIDSDSETRRRALRRQERARN